MTRAKLKEEDRALLRVEFDRIDENKDGKLDMKEFRKFVEQHFEQGGVSKREVEELLPRSFGRSGEDQRDLRVDFEEYVEFLSADPSMRFDVHFIRSMKAAAQDRIGLALYVPFLFLFIYYLVTGKGLGVSYWMQKSITDHTIGDEFQQSNDLRYFKGYEDQAQIEEFWDWYKVPMINTVWQGEAGDVAKDGINSENLPIGAMRLRQVRVEPTRCSDSVANLKSNNAASLNATFRAARLAQLGYACFPEWAGGTPDTLNHPVSIGLSSTGTLQVQRMTDAQWMSQRELTLVGEAYRYRDVEAIQASPVAYYTGKVSVYPPDGYGLIIPFSWNKSLVEETATMLQNGVSICTGTISQGSCVNGEVKKVPWLDSQSRAVSVEFMTYNQNLQLVTRVQMIVEITATGFFLPLHYILTFQFFDWSSHSGIYFFGMFIFVIAIVLQWASWIRGFRRMVSQYVLDKQKQGFAVHVEAALVVFTSDFWIIFDFINLLLFAVVWLLRLYWISLSFTEMSPLIMDRYPKDWEDVGDLVMVMSSLDAFNALLCCARVLYYLRLNSQLNLLTKTIDVAKNELFGILFIFLIVFIAFALMSYVVFGNVLEAYHSVTETISTLLRMLLGDFDYAGWREERRIFTPVVFLLFTVIGNFLLLNMVIAVLNAAFAKVQSEKFKPDKVSLLIDSLEGADDPEADVSNFERKVSEREAGCCYWMKTTSVFQEARWLTQTFRLYTTQKDELPGGAAEWYDRMREINSANPRTYWEHQEKLIYAVKRAVDFCDKLKVNPVPLNHHLLDEFGEDLPEVVALRYEPPCEGRMRTEEDRKKDHVANHDMCIVAATAIGKNPQNLLLDLMDFYHSWRHETAPRYAEIEEGSDEDGESDADDDVVEKQLVFDPEDAEEGIAMRGSEEVARQHDDNVRAWRRRVETAKRYAAIARRNAMGSAAVAAAAQRAIQQDLIDEQEKMEQSAAARRKREKAKEDLEQLLELQHYDELVQILDNLQFTMDRMPAGGAGKLTHSSGLCIDARSLLIPECIEVKGGCTVSAPNADGVVVEWSANGSYHRHGVRNGRPMWKRKKAADADSDDATCILWADSRWWIGVPRTNAHGRACVPALHWWADHASQLPPQGTDSIEEMMPERWESVMDGGHGSAPVVSYCDPQATRSPEDEASLERSTLVQVGADGKVVTLPRLIKVSEAGSQQCNGAYELLCVDPAKRIPARVNEKPVWRKHCQDFVRYFEVKAFCTLDEETGRVQSCPLRIKLRDRREEIADAFGATLRVPGEHASADRLVELQGDWQMLERAYQVAVGVAREERRRLLFVKEIKRLCHHSEKYRSWFERQCRKEYDERFGSLERLKGRKIDQTRIDQEKEDRRDFCNPMDHRHFVEPFLRECAQCVRRAHGKRSDKAPGYTRNREDEIKTQSTQWDLVSEQDILPEVFFRYNNVGELKRVPDKEVVGDDEQMGLLDFVRSSLRRLQVPGHAWDAHMDPYDAGFDVDLMWERGRWVLNERRSSGPHGYRSFAEHPPRTFLVLVGDMDGDTGDLQHSPGAADFLKEQAGESLTEYLRELPVDKATAHGWNREQIIRNIPTLVAMYSAEWRTAWAIANSEEAVDSPELRRSTWGELAQGLGCSLSLGEVADDSDSASAGHGDDLLCSRSVHIPSWSQFSKVPPEAVVPISCKPRVPQVGQDTSDPGDPDWPFMERKAVPWYHESHRTVVYGIEVEDVFRRGDKVSAEVLVPRGTCKGSWLPCEILAAPKDDETKYTVAVRWHIALRTSNNFLHKSYLEKKMQRGVKSDVYRVTHTHLRKRPNMGAEYWTGMFASWVNDPHHRIHIDFPGLRGALVQLAPQAKVLYCCDDPHTRLHPPLFPTRWMTGMAEEEQASALGDTLVRREQGESLTLTASTRVRLRSYGIGGLDSDPRYLAVHHAFTSSWYVSRKDESPKFWTGDPGTGAMQAVADSDATPPDVVIAEEEEGAQGWLRVVDPPPKGGHTRFIKAALWEKLPWDKRSAFPGATATRDVRDDTSMLVCAHKWRNEATEWDVVRESARGSRVYIRKAPYQPAVDRITVPASLVGRVAWQDAARGTSVSAVPQGAADARVASVVRRDEDSVTVRWGDGETTETRDWWEGAGDVRRVLGSGAAALAALGLKCQGSRVTAVAAGSRADAVGMVPGMTIRECAGAAVGESSVSAAMPLAEGAAVVLEVVAQQQQQQEDDGAEYPQAYKGDGKARFLASCASDGRDLRALAYGHGTKQLSDALWVSAKEQPDEECLWDVLPSSGFTFPERRREVVGPGDPRHNPQVSWQSKESFIQGSLGEGAREALSRHGTMPRKERDEAQRQLEKAERRWDAAQRERVDPRPEDEDDVEWWQRDHMIKEWLRLDMRVERDGGKRELVPMTKLWVPRGRWASRSEADPSPVDEVELLRRVTWYRNYWRLLTGNKKERLSFQDSRKGMTVELSPKRDSGHDTRRYMATIVDRTEDAVLVTWKGTAPRGMPQTWRVKADWWDPRVSEAGIKVMQWKAKWRREYGGAKPSRYVLQNHPDVAQHYQEFMALQGINPMVRAEERAALLDAHHRKDDRTLKDKQVLDDELERNRHFVFIRASVPRTEEQLGGDRFLSVWRNYPETHSLTAGNDAHGGRWVCKNFAGPKGPERAFVQILRTRRSISDDRGGITEQWTISAYRWEGVVGARVVVRPPRVGATELGGTLESVDDTAVTVLFDGDSEPTRIPRNYWDSVHKDWPGDKLQVETAGWSAERGSLALLWRATWPSGRHRDAPTDNVLVGEAAKGHGLFWRGKGMKEARAFDITVSLRTSHELAVSVEAWRELGHEHVFVFHRSDDLERDVNSHFPLATNDRTAAAHVLWAVEPVQELDTTIADAVKRAIQQSRRQLHFEFKQLIKTEMEFLFKTAVPNLLMKDLGPNQLVQTLNFKIVNESVLNTEDAEKTQTKRGARIVSVEDQQRARSRIAEWSSGVEVGLTTPRSESARQKEPFAESGIAMLRFPSPSLPAEPATLAPGAPVPFEVARPGMVVSLNPEGETSTLKGLVIDKDETAVVVRWNTKADGGRKADGPVRVPPAWWKVDAAPTFVCLVPDQDSLEQITLPNLLALADAVGKDTGAHARKRPGAAAARSALIDYRTGGSAST
eukprot:TRINITY_DN10787_c0_g1_i1.p1 TRINITY_DN10787_c0_g1~~TRINITY_DN10787_c0_g1_i1.p1  ORF type:complete len:3132 (+),score=1109.26 TRINITY_DN10787_c0_g1_i1:72-9467(+)